MFTQLKSIDLNNIGKLFLKIMSICSSLIKMSNVAFCKYYVLPVSALVTYDTATKTKCQAVVVQPSTFTRFYNILRHKCY